ncbi:restriction endonuclease [Methylococcaceae bacterium CS1]|uniref:Uma2 family endonuclease n=1 Tax=Bathymodiolus platifrons methanotrophic gill symbiont TaxID=113268 RepID=UPI000B40A87A|nr:Uma2 family endonuclease [Bathymodiolus platifrons methanotrophic gill symbiont]MCK5869299.1 Uma2 family endonuclease [Methyloprofundus sp.]TXK99232.1 restriction endonuclease [Methylococcaceae bacterium CS4]TXL00174.1 restriction endonuclease [Methylococcaceae bacterium CS5]TXL08424.1 restriction endonuclease [Methylococcaceae bacterium CS1]TXL09398.1 restriction endonuclease [Methylococcaceae bacterium CS3]TXL11982.1 restriction endonuclease [Methylococcaceae bacterium CS2]TXL21037.1 re
MMKITQLSQLDSEATYSYADYLTWQLDKAVELIRGKVMLMSPAPNVKHQSIVTNLGGVLYQFFYKKPCKLFYAPFDVRLYDQHKSIKADQDIYTVVQPDLSVICDPEKLTEQGCLGAPDWIIEILSPGNSKKEMQIKYALYQESGVKEYWMVYPYEKAVHQFMLDVETEKYQLIAMFAEEDYASPQVFSDLKIDLQEVFSE